MLKVFFPVKGFVLHAVKTKKRRNKGAKFFIEKN